MRLGTFFLLSVSLLISGICRSQPVIVNGNFEADGEQSPRFVPSGWTGGTPTGPTAGQGAPQAIREDPISPTLMPALENAFGGRGWMVGWGPANASDTISQEIAVEPGKRYWLTADAARYYGGLTGPAVPQASVALMVDYTGDSEYDTTSGVVSGRLAAEFNAEKTPIKVTLTITGYYEEDDLFPFYYSISGGVIDNVAIQEIPPSDTITIPVGNSPPVTFAYTGVTMDFLSNTVAGDVTVDVMLDPILCPMPRTSSDWYWYIYGLESSSFQVYMTFSYSDEEISAAGLDESNLTIWRGDSIYSYGGGGPRQLDTYLNTTANTIRTVYPQTEFGSFYIAEKRPQATVTVPAEDPPPITFGDTGVTFDFPQGNYPADVTVTKEFGPSECLGSGKVGYWMVHILGEPWIDTTAVMTCEYTHAEIQAAGLDETKLSLWVSYDGPWNQLESLVDPIANTITTIIDPWFWTNTFAIGEGPARWTVRVPVGDVAPIIFGNTGVTIDFSSNDTEGDVTVIKIWDLPPGLANAIGVHWDISGLSPGTFEGVITFTYSDMDVFLAHLEESSLRLWKSEGAGVWIEVASVLDTEANTITTAAPQTSFSLWAITGELSVTAADNWEVFR